MLFLLIYSIPQNKKNMFFNKSFILFKVLIVSLQIWRTVTWNPALVEDRETCFEFHSLSLLWWTPSSSPSSASAVWFSAAAHLTPCSVSHCILHYHGPINIHVTIQWSLTTALTTAQTHGGSGGWWIKQWPPPLDVVMKLSPLLHHVFKEQNRNLRSGLEDY